MEPILFDSNDTADVGGRSKLRKAAVVVVVVVVVVIVAVVVVVLVLVISERVVTK